MKKLYTLILTGLFLSNLIQGQGLVLTKAQYEPVLGDVSIRYGYDSVGVVPKNTGLNQTWNFSNLIWSNGTANSTFTTIASAAPFNTCCSQANLAEETGGTGNYNFWQSTATSFVLWGLKTSTIALTFTNSAVVSVWPLSYTYTNTDIFSGTAKSGTLSGPANGTVTGTGLGTGTVILPAGLTFTDCLQTRVSNVTACSFMGGLITATITSINYQYYHASQKFPLLNANYIRVNSNVSTFNSFNCDILVNGVLYVGINDYNLASNYTMFPNPAKDKFTVQLSKVADKSLTLEIVNSVGQIVKTQVLNSEGGEINADVDISSLNSGIYFVRTTLDNKVSTKKLIIE